jgi:hypothetical protein
MSDSYTVRQLGADDLELMDALLRTFGEVFNDLETYTGRRPGSDYVGRAREYQNVERFPWPPAWCTRLWPLRLPVRYQLGQRSHRLSVQPLLF